jgi:hypothetical protein
VDRKKIVWRGVTYGVGALATLVARRALVAVWGGVKHEAPPDDPANRDTPWITAVTWAVATGIGLAVVRVLAMRGAARAWEATTHEPPPINS